jgi:hypothetical protein
MRDGLTTPAPSIIDLAKLLIPRGVSAEKIAARAKFGFQFGEKSERLDKLIAEFETYMKSDELNIAAVGRAGVEMLIPERDAARAAERTARIRGDR